MAGRKVQRLHAVQTLGNPRLTKAEIAERKALEERVKGSTDKIAPPAYYKGRRDKIKKFKEIADQLLELEIIQNLDVDSLAQYVDCWFHYQEAEEALQGYIPTDRTWGSIQRNRDILVSQIRRIAGDLGLTFDSRMKLVIPKKEEEKPQSKFAKFG